MDNQTLHESLTFWKRRGKCAARPDKPVMRIPRPSVCGIFTSINGRGCGEYKTGKPEIILPVFTGLSAPARRAACAVSLDKE